MNDLSYRTNINKQYNLINLNKCKKLLKDNLPLIGEGWGSKIYKVKTTECGSIVLKVFKKERYSHTNRKKIIYKNINKDFDKEINFLKMCNDAILNFNCPNFMQMYDFDIKTFTIITEYFDGDSTYLFDNTFYKQKYYDTYIIQFLMGLLFLEKHDFRHGDFKPNNILFKHIKKNILFHYKLDSIDFYVPTYGYLYAIMDFGNAYKLKYKKTIDNTENTNDIKYYVSNINRTMRYTNVKKYLKKYTTIDNFLNIFNNNIKQDIKNNSTYENDLTSYISYALKKNYLISDNSLLNKYIFEIKNILNYNLSLNEILKDKFLKYTVYKKKYDKYQIIDFNL